MNSLNMITGKFEANAMYNFSRRSISTSFLPLLPPLKERASLFTPNFRNRFVACSPRFISTRILCSDQSFKRIEDESREERRKSSFNMEAYMLDKRNSVNKALDAAVPLKEPAEIQKAMRYSLLSESKRVCSTLCIACCELFGGNESAAMPAACSIEMMIAVRLMLDNDPPCMDNSVFHRRKPANHEVFGGYVTLSAADSLEELALNHLENATKDVSFSNILRVKSELATLLIGAAGLVARMPAYVIDIRGKSGIGLELKQATSIPFHKAASFFEVAAVAGAILGGASEEEIRRLRKYSKYAGLLYQVVDDILDVTKSDQELGKPTGKDLVSDKATYPKLIGLERSRDMAEEIVMVLQAQLVGFDPEKAAPLKALIGFLYDRLN